MNQWFEAKDVPRRGTIEINPVDTVERFTAAERVWKYLNENSGPGWVCTTDRVRRVPCSDLGGHPPLSAEIAVTADTSLHLRYGDLEWTIWRLTETIGDGPQIAFDEVFESTEGRARMRYRTWWHLVSEGVDPDAAEVWRPYVSRFVGWEDR